MNYRDTKGLQIAKTQQIRKTEKGYIVPSQSGKGTYIVTADRLFSDILKCTCADYELRKQPCKHIRAVQYTITKEIDKDGSVSITQTKRITYSQDWSNYTRAQVNEKDMLLKLLFDLCQHIERAEYKFGRPQLPLMDMVFSSALKVYTGFSLRRFMSDVRMAKERGYVENECSYASVSNYMRKEELTPIIQRLIVLSAQPLITVEENFAIDSTGFRATKFNDYMTHRYNILKEHDWLKLHICTGVNTNIITAAEVNMSGDATQFVPLAQKTIEAGFSIKKMFADKAYNSIDNYNAIQEIGGTAYIPFKSNATGGGGNTRGNKARLWRKMFHYFQLHREDFLQHYHGRSNVEATVNMVKSKFTDLVRSKDSVSQENELLLKVLCHNIVVLIHESYTLGVDINGLGLAN